MIVLSVIGGAFSVFAVIAVVYFAVVAHMRRAKRGSTPGSNHPARRGRGFRVGRGAPYAGPTPGTLGARYVAPTPDDGMFAYLAADLKSDPGLDRTWQRHHLFAGRLDGAR